MSRFFVIESNTQFEEQMHRARLLENHGHTEMAVSAFERASSMTNDARERIDALAEAERLQHDPIRKAVLNSRLAVALAANQSEMTWLAYEKAGDAFHHAGCPSFAAANYVKAIEMNPPHASAQVIMAKSANMATVAVM